MFEQSAVKAAGEWELDVLGLPFGSDRQGQIFDRSTDIGLSEGDEVPALYYHGFAERAAKSVKRLGTAIYKGVTDAGHVFRVKLDSAHEKARDVYEAAKAGTARASSDSSAHLVRPHGIVGKPGKVSAWPIFALSLMDAETADAAINPRAVAMAAAKALVEEIESESATGADDAAKAGKTFNAKNRERLLAMKATLDEMLSQIDESDTKSEDEDEYKSKSAAIIYDGSAQAAKGETIMEENKQEVQAQPDELAAVKAQIADLEKRLIESQRPSFNVNTGKGKDSGEAVAESAAKAFELYMRTGDKSALKAANETTSADGGFLVPRGYSNELVTAINEGSILRRAGARVLNVSGTNSFRVPTMTNATTAAVIKAESTSFSEEYPTIGEVEFTPFKYTALSLATDELLADSRLDVFNQVLAPDAANRFVKAENTDFATGNGSTAAQGITVGASVGITAAATNAITADEIIDTFHSLKSEYRDRAVWIMNDATLKVIRKYRENGTTGAYLYENALANGTPATLMGRPVFTLSTMPTIATGNKVIAFGDLSYYWIADFGGLSFLRLNERYSELGQVGFRWFKRMDANVMLSEAIKVLRLA
jgi:HK97 family phage major capsid protein